MPAITRDEVAHLARLSRLALRPEELDALASELDVIISAVAQVQDVVSDDIPPSSHALPLENVSRPDEIRPGLSQQEALAGAPAVQDGRFRVPRILEEEA